MTSYADTRVLRQSSDITHHRTHSKYRTAISVIPQVYIDSSSSARVVTTLSYHPQGMRMRVIGRHFEARGVCGGAWSRSTEIDMFQKVRAVN